MKTSIKTSLFYLVVIVLLSSTQLQAQSNTFPSSGNVGIGTSSPSSNLHISSGTSGDAVLKLESDTDNNNEGDNSRIELLQDGGTHGAFIGFNSNWSGSGSDNLFRIVARGSNTNDENAFVIKTMGSGPNMTSQVGIGTTSPTQKLDVNGTIGHSNTITSKGANYSSVWMKFKQHQYGNSLILGGGGLTAIGSGESANHIHNNRSAGEEILYLTSDNGTRFISNLQDGWNNRVEAMEIKSDGKIGIGTTTPSHKLSVAWCRS